MTQTSAYMLCCLLGAWFQLQIRMTEFEIVSTNRNKYFTINLRV